jgi:hypothetical protein
MPVDLTPPSDAILPPTPELHTRLAVALREVRVLRRLIRVAESVRPHPTLRPKPLSEPRETARA